MDQSLQERFEKIRREYKKGKRKLERLQSKSRAKAHVQQKLREQAGLEEELTQSRLEEASDNTLESRNSSFDQKGGANNQVLNDDGKETEREDRNSGPEISTEGVPRDNTNNDRVENEDYDRISDGTMSRGSTQERVTKGCFSSKTSYLQLKTSCRYEVFAEKQGKTAGINEKMTSDIEAAENSLVPKNNEINSPSPVFDDGKAATPRGLSLSKYKKKYFTNKLSCSPVESKSENIFPSVVSSISHRSDNLVNNLHEKLGDSNDNSHNESKTELSGETGTVEHSNGVDDSDAIIFERRKPLKKTENRRGMLHNLLDKEFKAANRSPQDDNIAVDSLNGFKYLDSLNNNSNSSSNASQESLCESPLGLVEGDLKKAIKKRKRRLSLNGERRSSPRVTSSVSYIQPKLNSIPNTVDSLPKKRLSSKSQEHIIVSSMFQCLIDDVKRENKSQDFELPPEFESDFEKRINLSECKQQLNAFVGSPHEEKENRNGNTFSINNVIDSQDNKADVISSQICDSNSNSVKSEPLKEIHSNPIKGTDGEHSTTELIPDISELQGLSNDKQGIEDKDRVTTPDKSQSDTKHKEKANVNVSLVNTPDNRQNLSQNECSSPPLFESPTNSLNFDNISGTDLDNQHLATENEDILDQVSKEVTENVMEKSEETDTGVFLEQKAAFEIPDNEVVLSLSAVENSLSNNPEIFVVCLCTQSLRFYHCRDSIWKYVQNYTFEPEVHMKKNSGGRVQTLWLEDSLGVVLQQPKTTLTHLHLYLYKQGRVYHSLVDTVHGRSVNVKCLSDGVILSSHFSSPSTNVSKYTYRNTDSLQHQDNSSQTWQKFTLERVCGQVSCLVTVQNLQSAVMGLTLSRKLHIWNHVEGIVLCTIDLADVCSKDVFCPSAFSEQGYLFLPMLGKKKGQEIGSIIVVNPLLSTSETLIPLQQPGHTWSGCVWAKTLDDKVLCARDTTGQLCLWDLYDGHLVATLDNMPTSCFTTTQSLLAYVCKNVLRVYELINVV